MNNYDPPLIEDEPEGPDPRAENSPNNGRKIGGEGYGVNDNGG